MSENRPQMTVQSAVEVVAAVVDVEQGEKVLRIYREEQAPVDFVCMAHGTARTEMLDLLGIGETAKAIVMCMVSRQTGVACSKGSDASWKCDIPDAESRLPFRLQALVCGGTSC